MHRVKLAVLILQYNSADLTLQLLESIVAHELHNIGSYRIIVMDNSSEDSKREKITSSFPFVEFVQFTENLGFAKAHNRIMHDVFEPWVLLLNNDCILQNNAIEKLLQSAKYKDADFATCEVFNVDGTSQNNYSYLPSPFRRIFIGFTGCWRFVEPIKRRMGAAKVGYINGAVLLIKREVFFEVGLFNENYFMYREDFDLMLRLSKSGFKGWRFRGGKIIHLGGASARRKPSNWEMEQKYCGDYWIWYGDYFSSMQIRLFALVELAVCFILRDKSPRWLYRYKAALRTLQSKVVIDNK